MKTRKQSRGKISKKRPPQSRKAKTTRTPTRSAPRKTPTRKAAHVRAAAKAKATSRMHARSAAKMAAGVMSRRAAKAETLAKTAAALKPQVKPEAKVLRSTVTKSAKAGSAHPRRAHVPGSVPGSRPVVRVARAPQFTYMRAPGADSEFDVGDTVEVFCDHEKDGERIRGWVKGVVVQVDNKLVAVQFRSNVFLTDGWMVPDRILWYSLTSDQIRNSGLGKKAARPLVPEY